jgi:hypothetical protein
LTNSFAVRIDQLHPVLDMELATDTLAYGIEARLLTTT